MFNEVIKQKNMDLQDLEIRAEQTSQIYTALNTAILATIINATILVIVLWPVIEQKILILWLVSLYIISFIRVFVAYRYKVLSPPPENTVQWTQRFLIGSIVASLIWGSSSIFLFPTDDLARQVFLAFVIGGMAAGAVTSLSYIRLMVTIYLSFTLIPLSIRFFISGTELSIAMGSMVVLAFLVVLQLATQSYKKNIENIRMRIDNIKQAQSLKHSEHRYKTILETATDSFFLHDLTGKLIDVNNQACRSLGYTKNELIEMSVTDIELTADKDIPLDVWDTLKEGENIVLDGVHRRKDGSTFPVEVSLGLILMGNESFISVLARDVTERKRIEKMKEQFISTVSHELRTPLTSIRGSLSLLTGGAAGDIPKQAQEMLAIASNNTERLLRLINDLLDIQKIESDELEMEFEDIPIAPILKQAIEDNNAYVEQYGVTIILNPISKDFMVYANKDYLMQVMANLLSNAAKFSHENGVVEISVSQEHNDKIRISISDQGQGIPEDFYSKIFGKFSQSDSSDTRQKGGTGLGLNITKAIVEKHGGEIGFTSQVDKGTTFYFELPISNVTTN